MKNVKLKQTNFCFFILLTPILLPILCFVLSLLIAGNTADNSILRYLPFAVIALTVAAAIFLYRKYISAWIVLSFAVSSVGKWKKDRQFYFTDVNGKTAAEAANSIKYRMNHYAKELTLQSKSEQLSGAYKKRRHSWNDYTSGFEDYYVLYETQTLTKDFCSNAVTESKSIMQKNAEKGIYPFLQTRKERKQPVTRACALVIICNSIADFNAVDYVRKNFSKSHAGLAVCIYEAGTGRYFINGSALGADDSIIADSEATAVKLIKKAVFCNKLCLNENSYYMPADDLPYSPEKTLYEAFEEIKKELKRSDYEIKRTVKKLNDGEVYYDGELVYYKNNGRTLTCSVIDEEDSDRRAEGSDAESAEKIVLISRSWDYPKSSKMSKKDYAEAFEKINSYLKSNGLAFKICDFEKWIEEQ